ncbi:MAG: ATP synthase F0 subunit C [Elusimicrobiota bacterium]
MKKPVVLSVLGMLASTAVAYATQAAGEAVPAAETVSKINPAVVPYFAATVIAAAFGLAIAAAVCGIGQGMATARAVEGIARQPEAQNQIQLAMMIGLAFIESLVLYCLFIAIILLFANPFAKLFM